MDQDFVSAVVVSFANTPLNAAQLPLAAARAIHGVLRTIGDAARDAGGAGDPSDDGDRGRNPEGISGSAWVSICLVVCAFGGWWEGWDIAGCAWAENTARDVRR